jgi:hypothetical protein
MPFDPHEMVNSVNRLHRDTVDRWHTSDPDNLYDGLQETVCQQHQFNFLLWHEEDIARSPDVSDARIAMVKRAIDSYNQQRNDWIELVDEALIEILSEAGVELRNDAKLNTETPGSVVDRLSIMSLRIYHLQEQLDRTDVDAGHAQKVEERLERCQVQQTDLSSSLEELLSDLFAGKKFLKVYQQMKMYNDPTLNPYLYQSDQRHVA